jgi:hypothetical protein
VSSELALNHRLLQALWRIMARTLLHGMPFAGDKYENQDDFACPN